jgi:hypothetical protein
MLLHRSKKDPAFALLKQKTVRLKIEGELRVVQTLFRGSKKSSAFASLKQKTVRLGVNKNDPSDVDLAGYIAGILVATKMY